MELRPRRKLLRRLVVVVIVMGLAAGGTAVVRDRLNAPDPLDPKFVQCHAELQLATFAFLRQEEKGAVVRGQILRSHGMDTVTYRAYMVALEASPSKWNRFADQLSARYDTLQGVVVSRTPPAELGKRPAPLNVEGRTGTSQATTPSAPAISSAATPAGVSSGPSAQPGVQPATQPGVQPAAQPDLQKSRLSKPKPPRIPIRWGRRPAEGAS
jgi:hypothetical protein